MCIYIHIKIYIYLKQFPNSFSKEGRSRSIRNITVNLKPKVNYQIVLGEDGNGGVSGLQKHIQQRSKEKNSFDVHKHLRRWELLFPFIGMETNDMGTASEES